MKKLASIFITLIMIINICPCITAWADAESYNPYERMVAVSTPALSAHTGQASGGRVQLSYRIAVFRNLDFSDGVKGINLEVTGGKNIAPSFGIYFFPAGQIVDDNGFKDGYGGSSWNLTENGTPVTPHYTETFDAGVYPDEWTTHVNVNINIQDGENYKGLYDVVLGSSQADLFALQFYSMTTDISENVEFKDAGGNTTNNISDAASIQANADIALEACDNKNVGLTIGVYDSDNNMLYKNDMPYLAFDADTLKSGNIMLSCSYDNGTAMTDAAYAGLFVTIDGRLIKSKYYGLHTPISATKESFAENIETSVNEGKITVCGNTGAADENVMIYLKNADELLYIQEVSAKNGNYKFEFSPDIVSGTYTVEVVGEKGGIFSKNIQFISYKSIIDEFNNAADADRIKQILNDNAVLIGIDLSALDTDSDWIINEMFERRSEVKNISAVNLMFNVFTALATVNNGGVDDAIKNKSTVLGIPDSYKQMYENDDTAKTSLTAAVTEYISRNGKIDNADTFIQIIYTTVIASKTINAYSENNFADQPDKVIGRIESGAVADLGADSYVCFKNMDFGSVMPKTVAISYGVPSSFANGDIYICLGSKDNVIMTVKTKGTADWNVFGNTHYVLPENVARQLMGVHDIYVRFGGKGNFKSMTFTKEYIDAGNPSVTGFDEASSETENVSDMTRAIASAEGYVYNGKSNKVALILAAYDVNGSLMKIKSYAGDDFDNAAFARNAEITGLNAPKSIYSVLVNIQNGKISEVFGKTIKGTVSGVVAEQSKLAQSSDGNVYVYGKSGDAESAVIFIKKTGTAVTDFDNYALVYETAANENGEFGYSFVMPKDSRFSSGMYDIFVIDNNGKTYEDTFSYASVQDIEYAIETINGAQSAEEFKELLNDPSKNSYGINIADVLDIDTAEINAFGEPMMVYRAAFECRQNGFTSGRDLIKAIKGAVLAYKINKNELSGSEYVAVKENANYIGITENKIYTDYFLKLDSPRQGVFGEKLRLLSEQATSVADTINVIYKATALTGFTNELSWGNIDGMLNAFSDVFEREYNGYKNTLSLYNVLADEQRHSICSNYVNKTGLTLNDIAKGLKQYYNGLPKEGKGSGSGSGSGSGGVFNGVVLSTSNNGSTVIENTSFSDLFGYEWAKSAIENLAGKGVIIGRGNGCFDPSAKVTREEFIVMLLKAMGETKFTDNGGFGDVSEDAWYYKYVCTAAQKGIVSGYTDGNFGIGRAITREEMCVMVKRAASVYGKFYSENNPTAGFTDSESIAEYAVEAVMSLARGGIVSGMGDNTFAPKANTSRAEAAVIINRVATF